MMIFPSLLLEDDDNDALKPSAGGVFDDDPPVFFEEEKEDKEEEFAASMIFPMDGKEEDGKRRKKTKKKEKEPLPNTKNKRARGGGETRVTTTTRCSDGSSYDDDATNRRVDAYDDCSEECLREVVLKTMSENERENREKEQREDVEMGATTKTRGEYRPSNSENYSNNNYNENGFDAFDLDDFMADFVPPEEIGLPQMKDANGDVLKESEAQRKDRLRRNREAAQLSRARKKRQLEEFANAAKVFREQFLHSNTLVGKLVNENHVLRMHLAHLARFVTPASATEAQKMNLPPLPPPTLTMQHLQQQQQQQQNLVTLRPAPVAPSAMAPGGKILIPPFNPHAYAKAADANTSNNNNNNNNNGNGQNSNTNSPKRQRTKKSSVVATATALALSTACVLNNTNKAATVVARSGTAASIATNVGRLATRHLTALPGSFVDSLEGVSEDVGIIASPDLKQALEMNWTMPDQAEMEEKKHSKALAFASEAIKKLSFDDNDDDDKMKVKREETAMNLWSKEDKEIRTMLSDKEANKIDPWFAAFRAARMHDVIQKMSRVNCAEVFQYKLQPEEEEDVNEQTMSDAANVITSEYESPEQRIARKRASGAIPLDDGSGYPPTTTSHTVFQSETKTTATSSEDKNNNNPSSSIVSMLLPPWEMTNGANDKSAAAMLRRLTKTFIVMFSKDTGTYTTYACRLPIANL
ncbi:unnamed protein product [Bathycoccus prasinos]